MKFSALIFAALVALPTVASDLSVRLEPIGSMNKYGNVEYNDVWGYTDSEGREYALLGVKNGTSIIEITDAPDIREIDFIPSAKSIWKDIKTYGHYAYVVNETGGGMQILDLSGLPESVSVANTYTGFRTSHNLFIDTERGILFAEGNPSQPVRIFTLEDPVNPVQVSSLGVECHDIMGQDGLLYVSEGGHGTIGVFNYDDPANPTLVARFGIPRAGYVHNAWLTEDGNTLMTTEETPGKTMKIWDVSDLQNVKLLSEYIAPSKLAHNTHIKGNYAYISHYGSGLRIVDISNPAQPVEVAYHTKTDANPSGFVSAWGAFPFFDSGKVLISDIEEGLFVFDYPTE